MADLLAFPDILPFPLLSRHRLSADLLALLYLHAVDEHAEVLADRNQRRMLVVHLHAQRSVHRLRDFGNRGGRLVADLVGVDDRHPRHHDLDHHGLAVLALLGPGDELVAPAHDLADVRKADQLELADDLLDRHLGALSPGAHDLRDAGLNPNISCAESEEKREPVSDVDAGVVDSLKVLDPDGRLEKRPTGCLATNRRNVPRTVLPAG